MKTPPAEPVAKSSFGYFSGSLAACALWGAATVHFVGSATFFDPIFFGMNWLVVSRIWEAAGGGIAGFLVWLFLRNRENSAREFFLAVFPAFAMGIFLLLKPGFSLLLFFLLISGWLGYRIGGTCWNLRCLPELSRLAACLPWLTAGVGLIFVFSGFLNSRIAFDRLFFNMADWGEYTNSALCVWNSGKMFSNWPQMQVFSDGHFMPGFLYPAALIYGLFPFPETSFLLTSLILFGSAGLLYCLSKKKGLSAPLAAVAALTYLLYPSVTNLQFGLFYGPNPMILFFPLLFGFYLLYEQGHFRWAFALFLFSLLLKETMGVFWFGWGVIAFLEGNRKRGGLYAVIGAGWFFLCIKCLIPYFSGGGYLFEGQFQNLGGGISSILLSPITRPGEFWPQLFRWKKGCYLLLLLLPVFPAALNRPWLMLSTFPLVLFHFLRGSSDVVNISYQYQIETVGMFSVALVLGLSRANSARRISRWLGFLQPHCGGRTAYALAALTAALGAHWFFAQNDYGPADLRACQRFGDCRTMGQEARSLTPQGARIGVSHYSGLLFLFHRADLRPPGAEGNEYECYNLGSFLKIAVADHLKNLRNPEWKLLKHWTPDSRDFFLFSRKPGDVAYELPSLPEEAWRNANHEIPVPEPGPFQFRLMETRWPDGRKTLHSLIRVMARVERLPRFLCMARDKRNEIFVARRYLADATLPPEKIPVGYLMKVDVEIPAGAEFQAINLVTEYPD